MTFHELLADALLPRQARIYLSKIAPRADDRVRRGWNGQAAIAAEINRAPWLAEALGELLAELADRRQYPPMTDELRAKIFSVPEKPPRVCRLRAGA